MNAKIDRLFRRSIRLPLLLRLEHILQSIPRSRVNPSQLFLLLLTHQLLFVCRRDVRIRGTTYQIPSASLSHIHTRHPPLIHKTKGKTYPDQYDAAPLQLSAAASRRPDSRAQSPGAPGHCIPYSPIRRGRWCRRLV